MPAHRPTQGELIPRTGAGGWPSDSKEEGVGKKGEDVGPEKAGKRSRKAIDDAEVGVERTIDLPSIGTTSRALGPGRVDGEGVGGHIACPPDGPRNGKTEVGGVWGDQSHAANANAKANGADPPVARSPVHGPHRHQRIRLLGKALDVERATRSSDTFSDDDSRSGSRNRQIVSGMTKRIDWYEWANDRSMREVEEEAGSSEDVGGRSVIVDETVLTVRLVVVSKDTLSVSAQLPSKSPGRRAGIHIPRRLISECQWWDKGQGNVDAFGDSVNWVQWLRVSGRANGRRRTSTRGSRPERETEDGEDGGGEGSDDVGGPSYEDEIREDLESAGRPLGGSGHNLSNVRRSGAGYMEKARAGGIRQAKDAKRRVRYVIETMDRPRLESEEGTSHVSRAKMSVREGSRG
ncbi:hypothetical protein C8F01DRAFT_1083257 [Mycena amicta]|nr:hypothetical protein C8F01DRAFT_1083257 [Mycena amicta]